MRILMWCILALAGLSFGMLAAAGVFTVLSAVGLIPRFAGKTHSADVINGEFTIEDDPRP